MNDKYIANIQIHPPGHFTVILMFPECLLFILTLTFTVFYLSVHSYIECQCVPVHTKA